MELESEIMTFLCYGNLYKTIKQNEIELPQSYIDETNISQLISDLIRKLPAVSLIEWAAKNNLECQCKGNNRELTKRLLGENIKVLNYDSVTNATLIHRESLLLLISFLLEEISKTGVVSLLDNEKKQFKDDDLVKLVALINTKLALSCESNQTGYLFIIRSFPQADDPLYCYNYYFRWLKRYAYSYNDIFLDIYAHHKNNPDILSLSDKLKEIEKRSGFSIRNYYGAINFLFGLLILSSTNKEYPPTINLKEYPEYEKISFFLRSNLLNLDSFSRRTDSDIFKKIGKIHDSPFIEIKENEFTILDLKFFMNRSLRAMFWTSGAPTWKAGNGRVMEGYFNFLMRNIFNRSYSIKSGDEECDGIISFIDESKNKTIIIFEFTTEYYRIESLYNSSVENSKEDIFRILFNNKRDKTRKKKDPGKFIKLNEYIKRESGDKSCTIIPVLVTEFYLGDFNLLEKLTNFIEHNLKNLNLSHLISVKPLIISLDDIEIFWSLQLDDCPEDAISTFIRCYYEWNSVKINKSEFYYNFSFFIAQYLLRKNPTGNRSYNDFFKPEKIIMNDLV